MRFGSRLKKIACFAVLLTFSLNNTISYSGISFESFSPPKSTPNLRVSALKSANYLSRAELRTQFETDKLLGSHRSELRKEEALLAPIDFPDGEISLQNPLDRQTFIAQIHQNLDALQKLLLPGSVAESKEENVYFRKVIGETRQFLNQSNFANAKLKLQELLNYVSNKTGSDSKFWNGILKKGAYGLGINHYPKFRDTLQITTQALALLEDSTLRSELRNAAESTNVFDHQVVYFDSSERLGLYGGFHSAVSESGRLYLIGSQRIGDVWQDRVVAVDVGTGNLDQTRFNNGTLDLKTLKTKDNEIRYPSILAIGSTLYVLRMELLNESNASHLSIDTYSTDTGKPNQSVFNGSLDLSDLLGGLKDKWVYGMTSSEGVIYLALGDFSGQENLILYAIDAQTGKLRSDKLRNGKVRVNRNRLGGVFYHARAYGNELILTAHARNGFLIVNTDNGLIISDRKALRPDAKRAVYKLDVYDERFPKGIKISSGENLHVLDDETIYLIALDYHENSDMIVAINRATREIDRSKFDQGIFRIPKVSLSSLFRSGPYLYGAGTDYNQAGEKAFIFAYDLRRPYDEFKSAFQIRSELRRSNRPDPINNLPGFKRGQAAVDRNQVVLSGNRPERYFNHRHVRFHSRQAAVHLIQTPIHSVQTVVHLLKTLTKRAELAVDVFQNYFNFSFGISRLFWHAFHSLFLVGSETLSFAIRQVKREILNARSELRRREQAPVETIKYENKSGSRSTPPVRLRTNRSELRSDENVELTENFLKEQLGRSIDIREFDRTLRNGMDALRRDLLGGFDDSRSELRSLWVTTGVSAAVTIAAWFFFKWADRGERKNRLHKEARALGAETYSQFVSLLGFLKEAKNYDAILKAIDERLKGKEFQIFIQKMHEAFEDFYPEGRFFEDMRYFKGVANVINAVVNNPEGNFDIDIQHAVHTDDTDFYGYPYDDFEFVVVDRSELRQDSAVIASPVRDEAIPDSQIASVAALLRKDSTSKSELRSDTSSLIKRYRRIILPITVISFFFDSAIIFYRTAATHDHALPYYDFLTWLPDFTGGFLTTQALIVYSSYRYVNKFTKKEFREDVIRNVIGNTIFWSVAEILAPVFFNFISHWWPNAKASFGAVFQWEDLLAFWSAGVVSFVFHTYLLKRVGFTEYKSARAELRGIQSALAKIIKLDSVNVLDRHAFNYQDLLQGVVVAQLDAAGAIDGNGTHYLIRLTNDNTLDMYILQFLAHENQWVVVASAYAWEDNGSEFLLANPEPGEAQGGLGGSVIFKRERIDHRVEVEGTHLRNSTWRITDSKFKTALYQVQKMEEPTDESRRVVQVAALLRKDSTTKSELRANNSTLSKIQSFGSSIGRVSIDRAMQEFKNRLPDWAGTSELVSDLANLKERALAPVLFYLSSQKNVTEWLESLDQKSSTFVKLRYKEGTGGFPLAAADIGEKIWPGTGNLKLRQSRPRELQESILEDLMKLSLDYFDQTMLTDDISLSQFIVQSRLNSGFIVQARQQIAEWRDDAMNYFYGLRSDMGDEVPLAVQIQRKYGNSQVWLIGEEKILNQLGDYEMEIGDSMLMVYRTSSDLSSRSELRNLGNNQISLIGSVRESSPEVRAELRMKKNQPDGFDEELNLLKQRGAILILEAAILGPALWIVDTFFFNNALRYGNFLILEWACFCIAGALVVILVEFGKEVLPRHRNRSELRSTSLLENGRLSTIPTLSDSASPSSKSELRQSGLKDEDRIRYAREFLRRYSERRLEIDMGELIAVFDTELFWAENQNLEDETDTIELAEASAEVFREILKLHSFDGQTKALLEGVALWHDFFSEESPGWVYLMSGKNASDSLIDEIATRMTAKARAQNITSEQINNVIAFLRSNLVYLQKISIGLKSAAMLVDKQKLIGEDIIKGFDKVSLQPVELHTQYMQTILQKYSDSRSELRSMEAVLVAGIAAAVAIYLLNGIGQFVSARDAKHKDDKLSENTKKNLERLKQLLVYVVNPSFILDTLKTELKPDQLDIALGKLIPALQKVSWNPNLGYAIFGIERVIEKILKDSTDFTIEIRKAEKISVKRGLDKGVIDVQVPPEEERFLEFVVKPRSELRQFPTEITTIPASRATRASSELRNDDSAPRTFSDLSTEQIQTALETHLNREELGKFRGFVTAEGGGSKIEISTLSRILRDLLREHKKLSQIKIGTPTYTKAEFLRLLKEELDTYLYIDFKHAPEALIAKALVTAGYLKYVPKTPQINLSGLHTFFYPAAGNDLSIFSSRLMRMPDADTVVFVDKEYGFAGNQVTYSRKPFQFDMLTEAGFQVEPTDQPNVFQVTNQTGEARRTFTLILLAGDLLGDDITLSRFPKIDYIYISRAGDWGILTKEGKFYSKLLEQIQIGGVVEVSKIDFQPLDFFKDELSRIGLKIIKVQAKSTLYQKIADADPNYVERLIDLDRNITDLANMSGGSVPQSTAELLDFLMNSFLSDSSSSPLFGSLIDEMVTELHKLLPPDAASPYEVRIRAFSKRSELRLVSNDLTALEPAASAALQNAMNQSARVGAQIVSTGANVTRFNHRTVLVLGPSVSTPDIIHIAAATGAHVMPLVGTQAQAALINQHFAALGLSVDAATTANTGSLRSELRKGARVTGLGLRDDSEIFNRLNRAIDQRMEIRIATNLDAFGKFFGIESLASRLRSELREAWFTAVAA